MTLARAVPIGWEARVLMAFEERVTGSRVERVLEALRTARVRGDRTRRRRRSKVATPDRHHETELTAEAESVEGSPVVD